MIRLEPARQFGFTVQLSRNLDFLQNVRLPRFYYLLIATVVFTTTLNDLQRLLDGSLGEPVVPQKHQYLLAKG